jgi:hypothetical protein
MREALIELNASDIGAEMGVIVSREENTPNYDSVKDLPGFYTRVSKDENRTVYLSMTDKMTASMVSVKKHIGLDGTKTGFDPLTNAPELMHPNTKYYAHIYSKQGGLDSSASTTKIEFTTEDYPTVFPTANASWSSVYTHQDDVVVEYKDGEDYLFPIRIYYDIIPNIRFNIGPLTINKFGNNKPIQGLHSYNMSGKSKFPILDFMVGGHKPDTTSISDILGGSLFYPTNNKKHIFKNKLVDE